MIIRYGKIDHNRDSKIGTISSGCVRLNSKKQPTNMYLITIAYINEGVFIIAEHTPLSELMSWVSTEQKCKRAQNLRSLLTHNM